MKSISLLKVFGIGIIGGILPLAIYFSVTSPNQLLSVQVIDGNRQNSSRFASLNPTGPVDFVSAAESTINSVVHATTKVVRTTFQGGQVLSILKKIITTYSPLLSSSQEYVYITM